jgi:O-acetyl-ADP-ribose deacetylase (regulator of RNase III)
LKPLLKLQSATRFLMDSSPSTAQDDGAFDAAAAAAAVERLLDYLAGLMPRIKTHVAASSSDPAFQRRLLGDVLIAWAQPLPDDMCDLMHSVLLRERSLSGQAVLQPADIAQQAFLSAACCDCRIAVWRGDIRRLAVDAIVNAANEQGLGCFEPAHMCIDNVLHRAAGPRLREACRAAMSSRPLGLLAGSPPIVTPGFALAAAHVCHVTGPCVDRHAPIPVAAQQQLASCYSAVLDAAAARGFSSVAFCCISTGLFGYDSGAAAVVASTTVRDWLLAHNGAAGGSSLRLVVFDVFTEADVDAYSAAIASAFPTYEAVGR